MFFDVATINVHGGDGGNGCMAMQREFRLAFGGPCGGNGGDGVIAMGQGGQRVRHLLRGQSPQSRQVRSGRQEGPREAGA
ncbi:MAG: hypothetical protein B7Z52_07710 [Burkholderiales bacterium 12-64-5]|nr:MAG: hypothetical protein B7Z52_07710 [Burkholderiales bacterium 12-64-5]